MADELEPQGNLRKSGRTLSVAERSARMARVVMMRRGRATWDQIATEVGVSPQRCHQIYQEALTSNPLTAIQVDEHRLEETELCDTAVQHLLRMALDVRVSDRTRVEAWNSARGWAERKAKLLGIDAPQSFEITTITELDKQIAALEVQLEGLPEITASD
jgi:hypothetical protein